MTQPNSRNHEKHLVLKRVKILDSARVYPMMDEGKTNQEIADAFACPVKRVVMMRTAWKRARGLPVAPRMGNRGSLAERLDARLDKSGPPHPVLGTPCWLYPTKLRHGYGEMQDTRGEFGAVNRRIGAHRVAWMVANRVAFPQHEYREEDPVILHKCDVPLCCNPDHLEAGTQKENIQDSIAKARFGPAKVLDLDSVREIKRRAAAGEKAVNIARAMGLPQEPVWRVASGRSWKHVG